MPRPQPKLSKPKIFMLVGGALMLSGMALAVGWKFSGLEPLKYAAVADAVIGVTLLLVGISQNSDTRAN